jgi:glycosyltransferase involved in cell wall biosynthesis
MDKWVLLRVIAVWMVRSISSLVNSLVLPRIMTKILIVTTVPVVLTNFLLPFATHFRDRGWQVDAMSCGFTSDDICHQIFDRLWEVQWSRNPLDPRNLLGTPAKIREIVLREQYDIIHVHTPVAAFVTRFALKDVRKQIGAKIIYTAHGFHFFHGGKPLKNAAFLALEKLASNWTDYLVTINREDEAAVEEHQLVLPGHSRYMPGIGVDLDYYNPQDLLAGGYGLLVDVGDIVGLTEAIIWILDRPEESRSMAQRGREQISNYDLKSIIKLHEELYAQALMSAN